MSSSPPERLRRWRVTDAGFEEIQDNHVTVDSRHNPDQVREMCLRYGQPAPLPGLPPIHVGWIPWEGQKADWRQIDEQTGAACPWGCPGTGCR